MVNYQMTEVQDGPSEDAPAGRWRRALMVAAILTVLVLTPLCVFMNPLGTRQEWANGVTHQSISAMIGRSIEDVEQSYGLAGQRGDAYSSEWTYTYTLDEQPGLGVSHYTFLLLRVDEEGIVRDASIFHD